MTTKILVVDDEPANLALLRQILSTDHALVFARNGHEALAAAHKHLPGLILLDIQMPDMDGYSVCRALKADEVTAGIPVIFVSGLSETGDETEGFAAGAVDYIVKPVSPPIVRARVRTHLSLVSASKLEKSYHDAIHMLGVASEYKDSDTGVHIWRMADYSAALAAACGWDAERCAEMRRAAPMHDIGKVSIPDAILRKPGRLDDAERAVMQQHAEAGFQILSRSADAPLLRLAATIARHHHEKWNGSGYPHGLAGEAIPEVARIVAIADVFDALSVRRPYKAAWPIDQVMTTLTVDAGSHFDPDMVKAFTDILPQILEIGESWLAREREGYGVRAAGAP